MIKAFRQPGQGPAWGRRIRSGPLTIGGRPFVLVSFREGSPELYRVAPTGLEMFVGYAAEVLPHVVAAVGAAGK